MSTKTEQQILALDRAHLWHPYSSCDAADPLYAVERAQGVEIQLMDGRQLVDGMSSWWSTIHGYNHPVLNEAAKAQLEKMAHVMFGGLTHEPAVSLAEKLVELTPQGLNRVFLADSGSISVEVAIKMALQYWQAQGQAEKSELLALRNGYHGDTFAAMSVCDPVTGMHHLFKNMLPSQRFVAAPVCSFNDTWNDGDIAAMQAVLAEHHATIAAVILEPIVQATGGMRFYSPEYLRQVRSLCDRYGVLLIADEIATGFGRTGKMFACEYAGIVPDILCLGKALTGGYATLAATLCTDKISAGVCQGEAGVLMHGPTFMGNPLACAIANASLDLLCQSPWQARVQTIEDQLTEQLADCRRSAAVADVRTLGAIGVVELTRPIPLKTLQPMFVEKGVWLRPFGKLIYTMPPFIITEQQLRKITGAIREITAELD